MRTRAAAPLLPAVALLLFVAAALPAQAPYAPANPQWNRRVDPFRIVGNLYYVGASDVSSYLIATSEGLILLDTGFRETLPLVESNIAELGFRVEDIRLLLISHGHYDHVGGLAEIKARTNASLLVNPAEVPLLSRGGLGDFAFGDSVPYPPVVPDGLLRDERQVAEQGLK